MNWIGKITLRDGIVAILKSDGSWECSDKNILKALQAYYDPHSAKGVEAILPFGVGVVSKAAKDLGGNASFSQNYHERIEGQDPYGMDQFVSE